MPSDPSVSYALAVGGPSERWYLSRAASFGNLMRTLSPWTARTWPTPEELELWVNELPDAAKDQLAGRTLFIVPLRVTAGPPRLTATIKSAEPDETPA